MKLRTALAGLVLAMSCGQPRDAVSSSGAEVDLGTPPPAVSATRQAVAGENEPVDCDEPKAETLEEYSKKCKDAMDGLEVPEFDCDDPNNSVEVPDTHGDGQPYPNETCDRPNVLNGKCDRGSRFQVIINKGDIRAVAHCRKKGDSDGLFNDIAVIQYNKRTGDTCFYQSVINQHSKALVPSPMNGEQGVWQSPQDTANIGCIACHDNGPFIRSPYLDQNKDFAEAVSKGAVLPGSGDYSWNSVQPYRFVGSAFQGWKTYSLAVKNTNFPNSTSNACIGCHRMAISSNGTNANGNPKYQTGAGTTFLFGGIATAATQAHKNAHSNESPIWMLPDGLAPNNNLYSSTSEVEAGLVKQCGQSIVDGKPVDGCNLVRFGQGNTCRGAPVIGTINGGTQGTPTGTKHETIVPMGSGPGNPGFCYWKAVHGPFFQTSSTFKFSDPGFVGSFLKIEVDANGYFVAHSAVAPPSGKVKAEPGGVFECTGFNEIADVTDISTCWDTFATITDAKGSVPYTEKKIAETDTSGSALTGYVGSLAQFNVEQNDRVRVEESSGVTLLTQRHLTSSMNGLKPGPSSAEAWSFGCKQWTPKWVARNVYTDGDVLLLSAALAPKSRCFITGITGAWSSTRSNETVQPYAEIYTTVNGDIHARVAPGAAGLPVDRVGAFASCVQIKP